MEERIILVNNEIGEKIRKRVSYEQLSHWEYIKDNKLYGLTIEDYKKMQNIILEILYCLSKIKTN